MPALAELLGDSPALVAVREQVARVLRRPSGPVRRPPPILILGETGTGKGLLAAAIHRAGPRAGGPFVDVNCAAIPDTLLEAELFGYERGAFTDARQAKPGLFQAASGGIIFLDEIGLLPLGLQSKLLRVIEERSVRRLGSTRSEPLDVWIVAATSEDLAAAVRTRRFREDLYHRLAVVTLQLPPLRERGRDVVKLAERFLARACDDYGLAPKTLTEDARAALLAFAWPGNVRELANVMERAALLTDARALEASHFGLTARPASQPTAGAPEADPDAVEDADEHTRLLKVLQATGWNISRAAERLGMPRNTLRYRLERHGLAADSPPDRRRGGRPPRTPRTGGSPPPPAPAPRQWQARVTMLQARLIPIRADAGPSDTKRAVEAVREKVQGFGGVIQELTPTAMVAAFGLEPVEDSPRRAALAAMAIRALAARARSDDEGRPDLKVALHTQQLPITRRGDTAEIDPDGRHAGWTILAALLERAGSGDIVTSRPAAGFLERAFNLMPLPTGDAFRLTGQRDPAVTAFVGRDRELTLLTERFEQAQAGQGQVVVVVGEPGIGKSRLLAELRRRLAGDCTWAEGHALAFGGSMPFHPVIEMLRRTYRIDDADPEAVIIEKLEPRILKLGEDLRPTLPFLRYLLSLDPGDPTVPAMDAKLRHAEIVMACHRVLERAAERRLQVLVLEDAHWMDPATGMWIAALADRIAGKRLFLILTCRAGHALPLGDRTVHTRLALAALSTADSVHVARATLGADELPGELESAIASKADGNPFFVEELVRSLLETGALRREGGRVALARGLDEVVVPDTVQDVILARIGRLDPSARRTLQLASIVGREFGRRLLDHVIGEPERVGLALRQLTAVELVYERTLFPEPVYAFKHALTHQVAYATMEPAEQRELHRRIGAAIEAFDADRLPEHSGLLAHHYSRAEEWPKALQYLLAAAARAAAAFATREALALYDQALEAAERQLNGADRSTIMAIYEAKAALHIVVSDFEQSRVEASRLVELARAADDRPRQAAALAALAWASTWARDLDGATTYAQQAIEVGESVRAESALARSHFATGFVRAVTGGLDQARDHLSRALASSRAGGDPFHQSLTLAALGLVKSWEGNYGEATALQSEGLDIARSQGLLYPLLFGVFLHGLTLTARGDYSTAQRGYHEGLALAERLGDETIHHRLLNCLGWLHLELGDLDAAEDLNRQSAAVGRRRKDPGTIPNAEINLGDVFLAKGDLPLAREFYEGVERYAADPDTSEWMRFRYLIRLAASQGELWLASGDLDRARQHAERCLELATRSNARKNLVKGWRLSGEIARRRRRWDDAEQALRRALALAEQIGNPPQRWLTLAALAGLELERGRPDAARLAGAAAREVIDGVLAGLADPALRVSLQSAPVVQSIRDLAP
ncbi:MAG TPA: sigma 54-interacting transcriptional regulator [Methylomirabilota bacterium]|nr:sigma 54-interacting transcriptional regulator [Methylomirabilota bacterium]